MKLFKIVLNYYYLNQLDVFRSILQFLAKSSDIHIKQGSPFFYITFYSSQALHYFSYGKVYISTNWLVKFKQQDFKIEN